MDIGELSQFLSVEGSKVLNVGQLVEEYVNSILVLPESKLYYFCAM